MLETDGPPFLRCFSLLFRCRCNVGIGPGADTRERGRRTMRALLVVDSKLHLSSCANVTDVGVSPPPTLITSGHLRHVP
eukprot:COSAG01_NODE_40470_length_463_cov_0.991758_1_plen_78_part_10